MKLGTFERDGRRFVGLVTLDGQRVFDFAGAEKAAGGTPVMFRTMLDLIDVGEPGMDRACPTLRGGRRRSSLPDAARVIDLLPPVPEPSQLREAALFPGHICRAPAGMRKLAASLEGREPAPEELRPLAEVPAVYRDQPVSYFQNRLNVVGHGATVGCGIRDFPCS